MDFQSVNIWSNESRSKQAGSLELNSEDSRVVSAEFEFPDEKRREMCWGLLGSVQGGVM